MSRFNYNFYLDTRKPLVSGLYSITINLYDNAINKGKNFSIKKVNGIKMECSKSDWDDIWLNKEKKNSFGEITGETIVHGHKKVLRTILKAKKDILDELLETDGINSLDAFKQAFNDYSIPTSFVDDVYFEFIEKIEELEKNEQYGHRKTFLTTLNNIRKYFGEKPLTFNNIESATKGKPFRFSQMNAGWLRLYENQRRNQGASISSISADMRNMRTLYNKVKKKDPYLIENYPFQKGEYVIKEGRGQNKGLRKPDLKKISDFCSENPKLMWARDIFIFAYYLGGVNYKDIITLTKKDLERGYFLRKKTIRNTRKEVKIPLRLNKEQEAILSRHKGREKYLFNILTNDANEQDIFKAQNKGIKKFNKAIKKIGEITGIKDEISYDWARHSFATNMTRANISERSIQEMMGHSSGTTTRRYIDSLIDDEKDDITDALNLDNDY